MRVLVTGAGGFVGHALVARLLADDHEVVALVRPRSPGPTDATGRLSVVRGDLRDRTTLADAVDGVTHVCHLAARTQVRESFTDPVGFFAANVAGTIDLLDALVHAHRSEPPVVVLASTGAVYGRVEGGAVDEDAALRPPSPYAASKVAAETVVDQVARASFIAAVTLRLANVAGAAAGRGDFDDSRIIPKAVAVAAGRYAHVDVNGDGFARRDYVHVLDAADAFVAALAAARPGAHLVANIGGGTTASVAEVIEMTRAVTGHPVPVRHHPPADEAPIVSFTIDRARAELHWAPHRSDLHRLVTDAWDAERTQG